MICLFLDSNCVRDSCEFPACRRMLYKVMHILLLVGVRGKLALSYGALVVIVNRWVEVVGEANLETEGEGGRRARGDPDRGEVGGMNKGRGGMAGEVRMR